MVTDTAKVSFLQVFTERGMAGKQRDTMDLIEGIGILGDRHADGREQQISILLSEVGDWMEAQEEEGLCFARYKENMRISGLDGDAICAGMHFQIGEAKVEILKNKKHCYHECALIRKNKGCMLPKGIFYAKVIRSGKVSINDSVICMQKNA